MDTRTKIISAEDAEQLAAQGATLVSGTFDPLIGEHAERLQSLKQSDAPLLVVITTPEDAILPARARAELVAALSCVDRVTEWTRALIPHVHLEEEHAAIQQRLIQHVHQRQQAVK